VVVVENTIKSGLMSQSVEKVDRFVDAKEKMITVEELLKEWD
jgi:hypothetical protein